MAQKLFEVGPVSFDGIRHARGRQHAQLRQGRRPHAQPGNRHLRVPTGDRFGTELIRLKGGGGIGHEGARQLDLLVQCRDLGTVGPPVFLGVLFLLQQRQQLALDGHGLQGPGRIRFQAGDPVGHHGQQAVPVAAVF